MCGPEQMSAIRNAKAAELDSVRNLLPVIMFGYTSGTGAVEGIVFDASSPTRDPVPGIPVCYLSTCDTTGADGTYELLDIKDGYRRVFIAASDEYYETVEGILVRPGQATQRDIALIPKVDLSDVFMRVVLTWDPTPTWPPDDNNNDLDANLWLEAPDPPTHIDSDILRRGDCTTFPNACLEADYQKGYGPETIAIRQLENTTYYYGVLNYYAGYAGVPPITDSQAKVRIYQEGDIYYEYSVPSEGEGDFWYVFSIVTDGTTATIQEQNCIIAYDSEIPECPAGIQSEIELNLRPPKGE